MRHLIILLVLFSCTSWLYSQNSVGFTNPKDTKPLLDYRLPNWGLQTFRTALSMSASHDQYQQKNSNKNQSNSYNFAFDPYYYLLRESEKQRFAFQLWTYLDYYHNKTETKTERDNQFLTETKNKVFDIDSHVGMNWQRYFNPRYFGLLDLDSDISFEERDLNRKVVDRVEEEKSKNIHRQYIQSAKIGFGFGRVRNVAPVIKALRLNERLAALGKSRTLNADEIQQIAQSFAKYWGYDRRYDRSSKYFWEETLKPITALHPLTPFEQYYLADVTYEKLDDNRSQGWYISPTLKYSNTILKYNYTNAIKRQDLLGLAVDGTWYHNLSLYHQLHIESEIFYGTELRDEPSIRQEGLFILKLNHLWNVSDRFWWSNSLNTTTEYFKLEGGEDYFDQHYRWQSSLSFYIEDDLSWYTSFELSLDREEGDLPWKDSLYQYDDWDIRIGLLYYFDRSLF